MEARTIARNCERQPAPLTAVILARNSELEQTLQSVLEQTVPAAEIIVVACGSFDLEATVSEIPGVQIVSLNNGSPAAALNAGVHPKIDRQEISSGNGDGAAVARGVFASARPEGTKTNMIQYGVTVMPSSLHSDRAYGHDVTHCSQDGIVNLAPSGLALNNPALENQRR